MKHANKRGPRATSSEADRKFWTPHLMRLLEPYVDTNDIVEVYQLHTFLYSEKSAASIIDSFISTDYSKAINTAILPTGFEDQDNEIGTLLLIKCNDISYVAILYQDDKDSDFNASVKRIERTKVNADPEQFESRMPLYPI